MVIRLVHYQRPDGRSPVNEWLSRLRDATSKVRIEKRLTRLQLGNFGDSRNIAEGVIELRIDAGPGYRIYLGRHGLALVILLIAGDKSTQHRDIELALSYWKDWKARSAP